MRVLRFFRSVETRRLRHLVNVAVPFILTAIALAGLNAVVTCPGPAGVVWADDPAAQFFPSTYAVSEAAGAVEISVSLDADPIVTATVHVSSTDVTASSLSDYVPVSRTLEFPVGQATITFTVSITNDHQYGGDKTFGLRLNNPTSATLGVADTASVTITEADPAPAVSLDGNSYSVAENAGPAVVTATLSEPSALVTTVDLTTADDTASHLTDYAAVSTQLTFDLGETTATATIPITNNTMYQGDRAFLVALSNPVNATASGSQTATVTIADLQSEPTVGLSAAAYSVAEDGGTAVVTATLSGQSALVTKVDLTTADGTASHLTDYAAVSTQLTFDPGKTTATATIPITNNTMYQGDRAFSVALSNPVNATASGSQTATVTIADLQSEPTVGLSASAYSVAENSGTAVVTATLSEASLLVTTVGLATSDGTASSLTDYVATSTQLTFAPGETTATATIPITNNTMYQGDRVFSVALSNPVNATASGSQTATVTIADLQSEPTVGLSASACSVAENNGTAVVTATLSEPSALVTTVDLTTADGTASHLTDYAAVSTQLTFDPGETTATATIPITDNTMYQGDRVFSVALSNPVNATASGSQTATVTIVDLQSEPTVAFTAAAYSVAENSGAAAVTATLSGQSALVAKVNLTTADGTASHLTDYAATSTQLTFDPGETTATATIPITNNTMYQGDRAFSVALSNPVNATASGSQTATVTILDLQSEPTVAFTAAAYSVAEDKGPAVVTVTVTPASAYTTTVALRTTDGTALAPSDYTAVSTTVTITPGLTSVTQTIPIVDDNWYEGNQTYTVGLSNPAISATLGSPVTATVTIQDNETQPVVRFDASVYSVAENKGPAVVTVTLDHPSAFTITVPYSTTAGTAVAWPASGYNYSNVSGTLVFTPGLASQAFSVPVFHNPIDQPDKSVYLALGNPTSATLTGTNPVLLWILDVDGTPTIMFGGPTFAVSEGDRVAHIPVVMSNASELTVTVGVVSSDGTALGSRDYVPVSTTLTIPGQQLQTAVDLPVVITDDTWYEGDRYLTLTLTNSLNATLAEINTTTRLTIHDNDLPPTVQFDQSAYSVSEAGHQAVITVTLNHPSIFTTTVRYDSSDGDAVAGGDYLTTTGTLTFTPGILQQTFSVAIINDVISRTFKGDRNVILTLSQPSANATLGQAVATLTITDADPPPAVQFSAPLYRVNQTNGSVLLTVTLTDSVPVLTPVTVTVATFNGTADATDYVPYSGTLCFSPGVSQTVFPITIKDDGSFDTITETVNATVTPVQNAVQGQPASAVLVITNDNAPSPSCPTCVSIASRNLPLAIPDAVSGALPGIITSTIVVSAPANARMLNLTVRIGELLHAWTSDLRLSLVAPNGHSVILVGNNTCSSSGGYGIWDPIGFANMVFDDHATYDLQTTPHPTPTPWPPPNFTGSFRPDGYYCGWGGLGALRGQPVRGVWKLVVKDVDPRYAGTLYAWSIEFQSGYNQVYLPFVRR